MRPATLRAAFLLQLAAAITGNPQFWQEPEEVELSDLDPAEYGKTWLYIPDGDGIPRIALMSEPPPMIMEGRQTGNEDVVFLLFTRGNRISGKEIKIDDVISLQQSGFDPGKKTKFLIHGWKSSAESETVQNLKNSYLDGMDYNVIAVDWSELASSNFYLGPKYNVPYVGLQLARFVTFLEVDGKTSRSEMHVLGHSLGAHVAGLAGHALVTGERMEDRSAAKGPIARITGLDPALPGFQWYEYKSGRLDDSDAEFVDVIHTCAGALGFSSAIGRADFYPNGGTPFQPGCCCLPEVAQACSHARAHQYYAESITSGDSFLAVPCDSWSQFQNGSCDGDPVIMGERTPESTNGTFYLETNYSSPFGLGAKSWYRKVKSEI